MNKQIQIAVLVAVAVVLGGGGFVAGMTLGPDLGNKADASAQGQGQGAARQQGAQRSGGPGGAGAGAALQGGGAQTVGRVLSVNNDGITVEVRTPGSDTSRSVIVLTGASRIVKTTETEIKLSDIKAGDQVLVLGQADATTGAISATAVIDGFNALQQLFGGGGGGAGGGARPSGASGAPRPSPSGSPRP